MSGEASSMHDLNGRAGVRCAEVVIPWLFEVFERLSEREGIDLPEPARQALQNVVAHSFAAGASFGRVELIAELIERGFNLHMTDAPKSDDERRPEGLDW